MILCVMVDLCRLILAIVSDLFRPCAAELLRIFLSSRGELLDAITGESPGWRGQGQLIERGHQIADELGEAPDKVKCLFRKSYPEVLVMQSAQDWPYGDLADPLDRSPQWCILPK